MLDGESNIVILADKGCVGVKLSENLKKQAICLMALKRSNSKNNWSKSFRQLIFHTRLVDKVFAYNLCLILNHIFYPNSHIAKIKHLIF